MFIVILEGSKFEKSTSQRGEDRGGKYLMRVVTGKDKDNSPQYRYIRSEAELEAYKKRHKDTKITHEDQKKESHSREEKAEGSSEKTAEEKKVEDEKDSKTKKFKKDKKDKKNLFVQDSKNVKKVKKSLYVL
jgi:hypothetical protein